MNEYNYQIVCYDKDFRWERVIRRGLNETEANEMLRELEHFSKGRIGAHKEGYIITRENEE